MVHLRKRRARLAGGRRMSATALAIACLIGGYAPGLRAADRIAADDRAAGRPIEIGRSYVLKSTATGDERTVTVYLPAHYADPTKHFPVVFLLDGGEHEDFHHITGIVQINAAYGAAREAIVVGIEGVDRRHDLTSPSTVPSDLKAAPTSGGAAMYREFLVKELKPWVAAHYRTSGRSCLIGESLGGLFTLETLLEAPTSFDDYIIVSPSLWWNDGKLAASAARRLHEGVFDSVRVWLGFETPGPPAGLAARDLSLQRLLESAFKSAPARRPEWIATRFDESHESVYHPAALQALRWMFRSPERPGA